MQGKNSAEFANVREKVKQVTEIGRKKNSAGSDPEQLVHYLRRQLLTRTGFAVGSCEMSSQTLPRFTYTLDCFIRIPLVLSVKL